MSKSAAKKRTALEYPAQSLPVSPEFRRCRRLRIVYGNAAALVNSEIRENLTFPGACFRLDLPAHFAPGASNAPVLLDESRASAATDPVSASCPASSRMT